jgi:hypothetical protein
METSGSEFNPWLHSTMGVVEGVPHRWEQTLGVNRMFFDADRDIYLVGGPMHETQQEPEIAQDPVLFESWNNPIRDIQSSLDDRKLCGSERQRRVSFAATSQQIPSSWDMDVSLMEDGVGDFQP